MPGEQIKLRRRLQSLQKAAAAGNIGAAGEANLLAAWLDDEERISKKRQDDRCKVLVGALVGSQMSSGRKVLLDDHLALLRALDAFLERSGEREAVLGTHGAGSEAFHRVFGPKSPRN